MVECDHLYISFNLSLENDFNVCFGKYASNHMLFWNVQKMTNMTLQ